MKYKCTCELFEFVEWVAHCTKVIGSIPEGEQKTHKYTFFYKECLVRLGFVCTNENYVKYIVDDVKPVVERYWRGRPRLPQGLA